MRQSRARLFQLRCLPLSLRWGLIMFSRLVLNMQAPALALWAPRVISMCCCHRLLLPPPLLLLKIYFYNVCVSASECRCPEKPEEVSYEPPDMGAGNELLTPARAARALDSWAFSPAPLSPMKPWASGVSNPSYLSKAPPSTTMTQEFEDEVSTSNQTMPCCHCFSSVNICTGLGSWLTLRFRLNRSGLGPEILLFQKCPHNTDTAVL